MKVRVKTPFFDDNGVHKKGEIVEVKSFNPDRMEHLEEEKKAEPKKATPKKNG